MSSSSWRRVSLAAVCAAADDIKCGPFGTQLSRSEFRSEGIPLWGIKHVNEGFRSPTTEFVEPKTAERLRQYGLRPGDIVMTRKGTVGNCAIYPQRLQVGIMHSDLLRLRVDPGQCNSSFLVHQLHHSPEVDRQLALISGGAVMPGINVGRLKELEIVLPPLPEQRRIAEILDRAQALRTKRREALALFDTLTQTVFLEMFGGGGQPPVTVEDSAEPHPKGWRWALLTDVARLATGHTPDRKRADYWCGEIPWVSLGDIRTLDGSVAFDTSERITQAGVDHSSAVLLPEGTVCFSRTASVGFVTVLGREMATSQDFVNWVCGPSLESTYLMHALLQSRRRLRALSSGSTHKTIYFPTVEQFRVLVPPIGLQRDFVRRVGAARGLRYSLDRSLAELDALFASLQHRAFRGEL